MEDSMNISEVYSWGDTEECHSEAIWERIAQEVSECEPTCAGDCMQVIAPKPETASLTAQERESIRGLVRKGCDAVAVTELFGLRDGELCEICEEDES